MKLLYTITEEDVGRRSIVKTCPTCGIVRSVQTIPIMGTIMKQDIGKRIYETAGGVLQVESQEQLEKRLSR